MREVANPYQYVTLESNYAIIYDVIDNLTWQTIQLNKILKP